MLPQEIIRAKRDGRTLDAAQIESFIAGLTEGRVTEGQAAAFAMAVFFRGMTISECAALTRAMTLSGAVLDWSGEAFPGPVLDKHSTGGIGDNVSLMLAPMIAACGGFVPMIAGRGLGHTGGTVDKLSAIPGYNLAPDRATLQRALRDAGCAIIGQTHDLAPADRRLYAIRDVTATVESVPLITASILSKKLAAGLHGLVLDVKTGSGAFMAQREDARVLATSLVAVANAAGLPARALITDMNQPLASAAGNAVELANAVAYLTGARRDARLHDVTMALGAAMLMLGGLARDEQDAYACLQKALHSGAATERFSRMVAALGGPRDLVENVAAYLPCAPIVESIRADRDGMIAAMDTRAIGIAVVALGGGRMRPQDDIDLAVGFTDFAPIGTAVKRGAPLCIVHARSRDAADIAARAIRAAMAIDDIDVPVETPLVFERIGA